MPNLTEFRKEFYGVRPNRFLIEGFTPTNEAYSLAEDTWIYVKAADLPGSNIGAIGVNWQGRAVKFSGERVYSDWVIQVYDSNVSGPLLREAFEAWIDAMDQRDTHSINYNLVADWTIKYSDLVSTSTPGDGQRFTKAVKLKNCFPTDLGSINLNYDAMDSFAEFQVQMAYDYWEFVPVQ